MNENEIQSFQSQIDELNELCSEVLSVPEEQAVWQERLGVMVLKLQDGRLEKRYARRLEKWLLADPGALDYYLDFTALTADLHFHFHPEACGEVLLGSSHHA